MFRPIGTAVRYMGYMDVGIGLDWGDTLLYTRSSDTSLLLTTTIIFPAQFAFCNSILIPFILYSTKHT